jgi:hypothetical protein
VTPALADLPAGVGVDLEFGYDDAALLRHRDGAVIWRDDTGWPYRGKDLHRLLGDLLRERLGERLHSFREDTPWWYWDAWE